MIDVREIKLSMRYPESRQEDITDAFMRGYTGAVEIGNKAIEKLKAENAKLSNQLADVTESIERVEERCAKLRVSRDEWHRVAVSKQDIIDHMRDARAENAKLRERIAELEELLPDSGRWFSAETVEAYTAENAKLLEIVSCLLTCANDTGDCDRCPLNGGTGDWNSRDFCDGLLDCLREVGVEVTR